MIGRPRGSTLFPYPTRFRSFAAVAFARTGHLDDADATLAFLGRVQPASGVFQARYLPDGSGVPDGRGTQLDGVGWALDRKSTRLNSSHANISYAVFCLKKKN